MAPSGHERESWPVNALDLYFAGPTSARHFGSFSSDLKYHASSSPEISVRGGFLAEKRYIRETSLPFSPSWPRAIASSHATSPTGSTLSGAWARLMTDRALSARLARLSPIAASIIP